MDYLKVIARFRDGQIVKGRTLDFHPDKPHFHLHPTGKAQKAEPVRVSVDELKAIFFVRDFVGNPAYEERKGFPPDTRPQGRRIEVTFLDGEVLVGSTVSYDPKRQGFFLFPADATSNNMKVFVFRKAMRAARFLTPGPSAPLQEGRA